MKKTDSTAFVAQLSLDITTRYIVSEVDKTLDESCVLSGSRFMISEFVLTTPDPISATNFIVTTKSAVLMHINTDDEVLLLPERACKLNSMGICCIWIA